MDQSFEALPFLRSALETHPQIEQFWISYFEALSSAGKHGEARAILEAGKKNGLQPNVVHRLEAIVLSAENCKNVPDATAKNDPPELRVERLAQLYETGLKQPMIDAAQHMLESFPKSALLHNMIGTACLDLLQYDQARTSYETAIALDPNYDLPHINLGVTLSIQGYFSEAVTHYQACLKIKPDNIQALIYIGNALQSKGDFSDAADSYRKAIAVMPDCAEAHNSLGNAQENQGNLEAAIKSYTQALVVEPDYQEARNNLNRVR